MGNDVFVVPIKSFDVAKERLRRGGVPDVTSLARELALGVLENCSPRHVIVISESSDVTNFARDNGAEVVESTASGLNEAVQGAYEGLSARYDRLIIVHGDLRYPEGLGTFMPLPGITLFADHHGSGTNVIVIPSGLDFHFAYGTNSLRHHVAEAERLNAPYRVVATSPWRFDVDEPSDLNDA